MPGGFAPRRHRASRWVVQAAEPTIGLAVPPELAAEFHQLRELAPAFRFRTLRQSIERAAQQTMECDNAEHASWGTVAQRSPRDPFRLTAPVPHGTPGPHRATSWMTALTRYSP